MVDWTVNRPTSYWVVVFHLGIVNWMTGRHEAGLTSCFSMVSECEKVFLFSRKFVWAINRVYWFGFSEHPDTNYSHHTVGSCQTNINWLFLLRIPEWFANIRFKVKLFHKSQLNLFLIQWHVFHLRTAKTRLILQQTLSKISVYSDLINLSHIECWSKNLVHSQSNHRMLIRKAAQKKTSKPNNEITKFFWLHSHTFVDRMH